VVSVDFAARAVAALSADDGIAALVGERRP
jgi:hypothetical protein